MRIEYDVTEDEYVEAALAAVRPAPPATPTQRRDVWATRVARGAMALIAGLLSLTVIILMFRSPWLDWHDLMGRVSQVEWVMPSVAWAIVIFPLSASISKGQRRLRVAAVAVAIIVSLLIAVVIASILLGSQRSPIAEFGVLRVYVWLVPVVTYFTFIPRFWNNRAVRQAYKNSPYAAAARLVVEFDDAGVREHSGRVDVHWRWTAFATVRQTTSLVALADQRGQMLVILPKRSVGGADAVDELVAILRSRVGAAPVGFTLDPTPTRADAIDSPHAGVERSATPDRAARKTIRGGAALYPGVRR